MKLLWVGPRRKAGHDVILPEQLADHLIGVRLRAKLFQSTEDAFNSAIRIRDGPLGVVLALSRQTGAVLEELFAVEVGL